MRWSALCSFVITALMGCGAHHQKSSPVSTERDRHEAQPAELDHDAEADEPEGACAEQEWMFALLDERGYHVGYEPEDFDVTSEVLEIGEGLPPEASLTFTTAFPEADDWRFMRLSFEETTHVLILRSAASFGVREGTHVRYRVVKRQPPALAPPRYEVAIHADERLALYLGYEVLPEDLRLLDGFTVTKGEELSRSSSRCYPQAVHALKVRAETGDSVLVAPGQKRWLGDYSVCVNKAAYPFEGATLDCRDGLDSNTELRLVRRTPLGPSEMPAAMVVQP